MFTLRLENPNGNSLTLTGNENDYQVVNIEGLNPTPAVINTTDSANLDGAIFNSAKLETKNIVILVKINGDAEANRQRLYLFCRTKELCTVYYKNQNRDVFIKGYVETFEVNPFDQSQAAQISILCPSAYFTGAQEITTDISNNLKRFYFPFAIDYDDPIPISEYESERVTNVYNASESDTGVKIIININEDISSVLIKNIKTNEQMLLTYAFLEDDVVEINTIKGQKSVALIRNGVRSNLFTAVDRSSTFFQLAMGDNFFSYLVDGGEVEQKAYIKFVWHTIYRGV